MSRYLLEKCREQIKAIYDFRWSDGTMPFGTVDYCEMEDLLREIDGELNSPRERMRERGHCIVNPADVEYDADRDLVKRKLD